MSLLLDPPAPPEAPPDVEALIEEARRRQRRRRLLWAAAALAAAVVGAALWFGIFHGGGTSLLGGSDGGAPSATYHRGWILHQRHEITLVPYAGAGHYVHLVSESWKETSPPYRSRDLTYPAFWNGTRVEMGAAGLDRYAYDPKSNTIYEDRAATAAGFLDPAAKAKRMIESGQWKVRRTTVDGRPALLLDDTSHGIKTFYDAETYVPLRTESGGFPLRQRGERKPGPTCSYQESPQMPASKTVAQTLTYEYLPPTDANRKLLEIGKQHPGAKSAPAKEMPRSFRSVVHPPTCAPPPVP